MRRVEEEARLQERRQQEQAEREAAARREAEAAQARERARQEAEEKANLDRETERILRERAEAAQAAAARELAAREEMERRRLDHENATRERERLEREIYEQEFNRKREEEEAARRQKEREEKLDYDIESRHRQLRERERDIVEPEEHSWKTPAVAAAAGIAAGAAVAGIAHSSKDNPFDDKHAHGDSRSSKIEYDDDHLYEDEIMDPNYFNKKDSSRTPSREREQGIARNAAKKVIEDMEKRYKDDRKQSAAEFFAPPELLDRSTPSKIDYGPDADVQVYHSPYVVTVQPPYDPQYSFTATKDGYDHKINKFGGVPTLNLIEPTPPVSLAGSTRDEHSRSPSPAIPSHTDDSGSPTSTRASERDKEREREEKQRKRTSVTWGADETFHYEAQTPESFREHYMSEHDMKRHLPDDWVLQGNQSYTDQHSYQGNDEIVVERDSPRSGKERVSYRPEPEERNRGWGPETESPVEEIKRFEDDGRQVIDSTSPEHTPTIVTPSEEQAKPYHSPFFESVSDFQGYDVSPGAEAERQRGQRGYVEGEIVDEPEEIVLSKPRETEPHMPGGWDDDEPQREAESAWAEPKLSKKEQKKREKASKRASLDAQAEAARLAEDVASSTGSLRDLDKEARREPEPKVEEPAWEPPLTKKEKKKREKEAARRASLEAEAAAVAGVESPREEPVVQPEAEWEPPLSKKEQKKRDKAAKRASLDRQDSSSLPSTPAEEPKAEDLWEDAPSSKKDKKKKKRDSVDRDPRDIEPSFAYPSPPGEKDRESSRDAKSDYESFDAANVPLPENESPPFSPSGDKSSKGKKHYVYDEPEEFPISTGIDLPTDPYGPPYPRDEARHSPDQEEDRSKYYPERGYAWEEEGESYDADGHRKHKHRKHRSTGDDDTRSVVSEFRDDEEDERRKHKHRRSKRESEIFDDSLRDRDARSEPGDILDREDPEKRKHKRRSKREGDFDDTASVVSSPAKYYEDDKKKDKEKEKKGIFSSIFGKSKESLVDTSSSKSHDNERQTGEETQQ
ncbi:hypothetical protein UCRNP2_2621 [Neofusicoccum parvum UCRNP2]|uniref:Involucrin repeat protein n=1 Tax=Botryosphaeria parva (strain UCR-NP2) TaxID=1287680 RepID=R1GG52_BOTPV|nr:hypothetical protein UCRNP2_2621 [Neofusicoccum parvum UCRNP2]